MLPSFNTGSFGMLHARLQLVQKVSYGRFKPKMFFVSGQRTAFACRQPPKRNMATWPEKARTGDIVISLQLLVSCWNSVRSFIVFSVQRTISKNALASRLWC